jgi:YD repeat-containing protein
MNRLTIIAVALAAILAASHTGAAEQTRIYDSNGRSIGNAVPYSGGSVRYYDAGGHSLGTSSTSGGTTTYYDARGNRIGTAAGTPRKR